MRWNYYLGFRFLFLNAGDFDICTLCTERWPFIKPTLSVPPETSWISDATQSELQPRLLHPPSRKLRRSGFGFWGFLRMSLLSSFSASFNVGLFVNVASDIL